MKIAYCFRSNKSFFDPPLGATGAARDVLKQAHLEGGGLASQVILPSQNWPSESNHSMSAASTV
eukprot:scaffold297356_cov18-Prasinocladus_malaysianus.AAC.1